jgi:adenosine deaminase
VAAAATALALSLTGVLGASQAKAPHSMRTMSFTLVSHRDGTATLTINPDVLLDATALQNDLQQDGIPAHVTSGSFCSSNPAPAGFWHVVSGSTAPQNTYNGEVFGPSRTPVNDNGITKRAVTPTITFNPANIPAGTELSFGDLPPGSGMYGVAMGLIDTNSAVPSLPEHPLPELLAAGVPVTLATDDPGMFHTDLNNEYLLCHDQFGLGPKDLAELARAGTRAAFCSESTRHALLAEIDQLIDSGSVRVQDSSGAHIAAREN